MACRHRFRKLLAFRIPAGSQRAGVRTAVRGRQPSHRGCPAPAAPTLPAGVSLGVLQGLGGGSERDALEDVHIVAKEAELLVDAFHEAPFCVH